MVDETVVIPARFRGPPGRGNGGVTAGMLAVHFDGDAEVTLRLPAPLDTPLTVEAAAGGMLVMRDGEATIAEGVPTSVAMDAPAPPSLDDARAAAAASPVIVHPDWHPFPGCFVCGPERAAGDGLRVHPGRVGAQELFAAPVEYPRDLADANGLVPTVLVWAALDCPSSFVMYMDGERPTKPYVLGRMAAHIVRRPRIETPLVACSWPQGVDGRKLFAASALYDGDDLVAWARATWISV